MKVHRIAFAGAPCGLAAVVAEGEDATRRGLTAAEMAQLLAELLPGRAVTRARGGQPLVRGAPALHLSVAHTEGATAVAVGPVAIGVDIERLAAGTDGPDAAELCAWTLTEARLKRDGRTLADAEALAAAHLAPDDASTAWLDAGQRRYCLALCWSGVGD